MSLDALETWVTLTWLPLVAEATVASSLVSCVVILVWLAVRRRASAHLGYALALLPLVPFVIPLRGLAPVHLPSPFPAQEPGPSLTGASVTLEPLGLELDALTLEEESLPGLPVGTAPTPSAALPHLAARESWIDRWPLGLFLLWSVVGLAVAARWLLAQHRTRRLVRRARPLGDPRARLVLRRILRQAGLQDSLRVAQSDEVGAPAVSGLWRPTLLLPPELAEHLNDRALAWSVHHELAHLRRHDLWVASLQRLLVVLWWFHPFVHLANRVAGELRECACDEAALARMPQLPRREAALALVDWIEAARKPQARDLSLASLNSEKSSLEKRIMRLIDTRRPTRKGLTPAAAGLLSLTLVASFASAQLSLTPHPGQEPEQAHQDGPRVELGEVTSEEEQEAPGQDAARAAVERALDWLVKDQQDTGRWGTGHPESKMAGEFTDVGVTALAIEALLGSEDPEHRDAAGKGLAWMAAVQDPESGLFGRKESFGYVQSHALAARLWFRVHGDQLEGRNLEVAQRALHFIHSSRNPYAGWRFDSPPAGDNDSLVTSLMLRALMAAEAAGLEVDQAALKGGAMFLDEVTEPSNGRVGYTRRGGPPGRLATKRDDFPVEYSEYPTAVALLARLDMREDPVERIDMILGSSLVAGAPPRWDPVEGTNDAYHWLFGTEALRQMGGVGWKRWRRDLYAALGGSQREDGSWPLQDAWSGKADRAHITAVYALALQQALRD